MEFKSESGILEDIMSNGFNIRHVENPSEIVQMVAVKQMTRYVEYINNPTEEVQLFVVRENWNNLQLIKNPTGKVILEAISQNGQAMHYIEKLSEELIIEIWGSKLETEEQQFMAIRENAAVAKYIKNILPNVQRELYKSDYKNVQYIENIIQDIQKELVSNNYDGIKYIKNPSEELQFIALKNYHEAIRFIDNPTENVQVESLKRSSYSINYIKNPTDNLKYAVLCKNYTFINKFKPLSEPLILKLVELSPLILKNIDNIPPFQKVEEVFRLKLSKKTVARKYVTEFLQLDLLGIDKNNFIYKYGSDKAIGILEDYDKFENRTIEEDEETFPIELKYSAEKVAGVNWEILKYIKDVTEETKLAAIKLNYLAINYINEPTEEMQLVAIDKEWSAIQYIKNPTKKVQVDVIKMDRDAIKYINNPSKETINLMLRKIDNDVKFISYLGDVPEELLCYAVRKSTKAIQYVLGKFSVEKIELCLIKKIKDPHLSKQYVIGFLQCPFIEGNKTNFIVKHGGSRAKRILVDYQLEVK